MKWYSREWKCTDNALTKWKLEICYEMPENGENDEIKNIAISLAVIYVYNMMASIYRHWYSLA